MRRMRLLLRSNRCCRAGNEMLYGTERRVRRHEEQVRHDDEPDRGDEVIRLAGQLFVDEGVDREGRWRQAG